MDRFGCEITPTSIREETPYTDVQISVWRNGQTIKEIIWVAAQTGTSNYAVATLFALAKHAGYTFTLETHQQAISDLVRKLHIRAYEHGCRDRGSLRDNPYRLNDWANRARYWLCGYREQPTSLFDNLEKDNDMKQIVSDSIMGMLT